MATERLGQEVFNGSVVAVDPRNIVADLYFQCRAESDTAQRAQEVADSVVQTGSTEFDDMVVVWEDEGTLKVVSGFSRHLAAIMLDWTPLPVFVMDSSYTRRDAQMASRLGNSGNRPCRPLRSKEVTACLVSLSDEGDQEGMLILAKNYGLSETAAKQRVAYNQRCRVSANGSDSSLPRRFVNATVAHDAGRQILEHLLGRRLSDFNEGVKILLDEYGVQCRGTITANLANPLLDWAKAKHVGEEVRVLALFWGTSGKHALPMDMSALDTMNEVTGGEIMAIAVYPDSLDRTKPYYDMVKLHEWFMEAKNACLA